MEVVDEQIDTVGRAMLGMTIGCARCHDHKFDPIPTRDYYALAGIFRSTRTLIHANVSDFVTRELPVSDAWRRALDQHVDAVRAVQMRLNQARSRLQKLTGEIADKTKSVPADSLAGIVVDDTQAEVLGSWTASSASPRFVGPGYLHDGAAGNGSLSVVFAPELPRAGRYEVRIAYAAGSNRASSVPVQIVHADGESVVRIDQRTPPPIDQLFISLGSFPFSPDRSASVTVNTQETTGHVIADAVQFLPLPELASELEGNRQADPAEQRRVAAARESVASLQNELAHLEKQAPPPPPTVMSVRDEEQPGDCFICIRGNVHNPGNEVPRGFLEVANWREGWEIPPDQSGRLELARWITEPRNPLTARVLVNRIWYHLLGKGLVSTADNFGSTGDTPSHPELLDRLAIDFIEHDWSIKQLVRRIVLSRVYQLSSESGQAVAARDPENRWLGRAHRRRLDAEVLRDSMLFCAGRLDMAQGGKTLKPGTTSEFEYDFSSQRRSVYVPVFRNAPLDLFEVFDMANPNLVGGVRTPSTRATQALLLMNSPFVLDQAQAAAEQLLAMAKTSSDDERLIAAYRRVLSRDPTAAEMSLTRQFIASGGTGAEAENPVKVWTAFCQTLFSCVDFRYVH
jgi:hypothetical protein